MISPSRHNIRLVKRSIYELQNIKMAKPYSTKFQERCPLLKKIYQFYCVAPFPRYQLVISKCILRTINDSHREAYFDMLRELTRHHSRRV